MLINSYKCKSSTSFDCIILGCFYNNRICVDGERTHFLLRACAGVLSGLVWKPKFKRILFVIIIEILAITFIFAFRPDLGSRYTTTFVQQIPLLGNIITENKNDNNTYWGAWRGGIQQFVETPILELTLGYQNNLSKIRKRKT